MSLLFRLRHTQSLRTTALAALLAAAAGWAQAQQPADKQLAGLLTDQKWSEALALIDTQLKAKPNDAQLLMNRGAVLSSMGRNADALAVFQKVAASNPQLPAAHNNMAVILAANGKYDEARVALEKAIRTHPAYATAYENLGDLYSHMAGDAYRKALQFDKNLKTAKPKLEMVGELNALASGQAPAPTTGSTALASVDKPGSFASAAGTTLPGAPSTRVAQAPAPAPAAAPAPAPKPAVEPPKPTPPVAAAPAPAPTPAPAPKPPAPAVESTDDVQAALRNWAKAWSSKDMKAYAAAYTSDFKGSQGSRDAWLKARSAVIVPRKSIEVKVSDVKVRLNGDRADVSFRQDYASDGRDISSRKSIVMQKVGGKWLIRDESGR